MGKRVTIVKSKIRGQTLHATESKESSYVNHQNRRYTIDTCTSQIQNRNSPFEQNFNNQHFQNGLRNQFFKSYFQPSHFQNTCLNFQFKTWTMF